MKDKRVVFMGTPDFAQESLRAIYEAGFDIFFGDAVGFGKDVGHLAAQRRRQRGDERLDELGSVQHEIDHQDHADDQIKDLQGKADDRRKDGKRQGHDIAVALGQQVAHILNDILG